MVKNSLLIHAFKNVYRSKINFINIILLAICSSVIIFGVSYVFAIKNFGADWAKKSIDFRTYVVTYDDLKISEEEAINKLKQFDHVDDVSPNIGYIFFGMAIDYINDNLDGQMVIRGVTKDGIKVILGENLEKYTGENVLICSKQFNPNSQAYYVDYDINNTIDLTNSIGKNIKLEMIDTNTIEQFKLIGLYDSNYNYSSGDTCYTTFETVQKINQKYQSDVYQNTDSQVLPIIMIIDNSDSFNLIETKLKENGFYASPIITINTKVGNNIIKIVSLLAVSLCIISFLTMLISSLKTINDSEKEFAIFSAIGFSNKKINLIKCIEFSIVVVIGFILSILISKISLTILKNQYLINNVEFSRMNVPINGWGLILSFIVLCIISFIVVCISSYKIEKINIANSLKE